MFLSCMRWLSCLPGLLALGDSYILYFGYLPMAIDGANLHACGAHHLLLALAHWNQLG